MMVTRSFTVQLCGWEDDPPGGSQTGNSQGQPDITIALQVNWIDDIIICGIIKCLVSLHYQYPFPIQNKIIFYSSDKQIWTRRLLSAHNFFLWAG